MTSRQRTAIALLAIGVAAAAAMFVVRWWSHDAEALINLPQTPEEGLRVLASDDFAKLPDYRKDAYRREVQRLVTALPEDQRLAMFQKYRGSAELQKGFQQLQFNPIRIAMDEYLKAPPGDRTAKIDRFIDQFEQFRRLGGFGRSLASGGRTTGSGAAPPGGEPAGGPDAERRNRFVQRLESQIQEGNPQETARMMEFIKHMRQRRKERGLPDL